jgi:hypothetical protein
MDPLHQEQAWNTRLIGHTDLNGHGDAMQIMIKDHYAYVAHMETMGFSIVDIANLSNPRVLKQIENPPNTHSHKLQLVGDILLVNQEGLMNGPPIDCGGVDIYDVSNPLEPRKLSHFQVNGKGVHRMWFVDGKYAHLAATADGYFKYIYLIVDVSDPENPREVGRWWLPGQWTAGGETSEGERTHCHFAIARGDRAYVSYREGGIIILDISDLSRPKFLSRLDWSPPYGGNSHTYLPLDGRGIAVACDEATAFNCQEDQKLAWVVDIRVETNPVSIATFPVPEGDFCAKGGRFGPHNFHENRPGSMIDNYLVYLTYFNAGVRIFDLTNPYRPEEVGYYVPETPLGTPAIQINDLLVHDDGTMFITDRLAGGLYIVEFTGPRPEG